MTSAAEIITGRFAPTPSGPLHMGSLVTAVASYCQSRAMNGHWLLRMEDLDTPRVVKGAADNILSTLEAFGFEWDGEVLYQSKRFGVYEEILQQLIKEQLVYGCDCSRRTLQEKNPDSGPLGFIYPGFCRQKKLHYHAINLRLNNVSAGIHEFNDAHFGHQRLDIRHEVGDIILRRSDGVYAYHLAVVLDDAFQRVNQVVRGADLLEATCLQIYLQQLLALPDADYLHIPLLTNQRGEKLSKQTAAPALDTRRTGQQLLTALQFLGQDSPLELQHARASEILQFAIQHWDSHKIPK